MHDIFQNDCFTSVICSSESFSLDDEQRIVITSVTPTPEVNFALFKRIEKIVQKLKDNQLTIPSALPFRFKWNMHILQKQLSIFGIIFSKPLLTNICHAMVAYKQKNDSLKYEDYVALHPCDSYFEVGEGKDFYPFHSVVLSSRYTFTDSFLASLKGPNKENGYAIDSITPRVMQLFLKFAYENSFFLPINDLFLDTIGYKKKIEFLKELRNDIISLRTEIVDSKELSSFCIVREIAIIHALSALELIKKREKESKVYSGMYLEIFPSSLSPMPPWDPPIRVDISKFDELNWTPTTEDSCVIIFDDKYQAVNKNILVERSLYFRKILHNAQTYVLSKNTNYCFSCFLSHFIRLIYDGNILAKPYNPDQPIKADAKELESLMLYIREINIIDIYSIFQTEGILKDYWEYIEQSIACYGNDTRNCKYIAQAMSTVNFHHIQLDEPWDFTSNIRKYQNYLQTTAIPCKYKPVPFYLPINKKTTDCLLVINGMPIPTNSLILRTRSYYFRRLLEKRTTSLSDSKIELEIPGIPTEFIEEWVAHLHSGTLSNYANQQKQGKNITISSFEKFHQIVKKSNLIELYSLLQEEGLFLKYWGYLDLRLLKLIASNPMLSKFLTQRDVVIHTLCLAEEQGLTLYELEKLLNEVPEVLSNVKRLELYGICEERFGRLVAPFFEPIVNNLRELTVVNCDWFQSGNPVAEEILHHQQKIEKIVVTNPIDVNISFCFPNCRNLKTLGILSGEIDPDTMIDLPKYCSNLESISIYQTNSLHPETLLEIGDSCPELHSIELEVSNLDTFTQEKFLSIATNLKTFSFCVQPTLMPDGSIFYPPAYSVEDKTILQSDLRTLILFGDQINNITDFLMQCPHLKKVCLRENDTDIIVDDIFEELAISNHSFLSLEFISDIHTHDPSYITHDNHLVKIVKQSPNLHFFSLTKSCKLTDEFIEALALHCPELEELHLGIGLRGNLIIECAENDLITDRSIQFLTSQCKQLRSLSLPVINQLTMKTLKKITHDCPNLQQLNMNRITTLKGYTNISLVKALSNIPFLQKLSLSGFREVDSETVYQILLSHPHLTDLDLSWTNVDHRLLDVLLKHAPKLRTIFVVGTKIDSYHAETYFNETKYLNIIMYNGGEIRRFSEYPLPGLHHF